MCIHHPFCRVGLAAVAVALSLAAPATLRAERLKDLVDIEGVRSNKLMGYGLVVGLAGTGDDVTAQFSTQSVVTMLRKLGVHVDDDRLRLRNVAAVMVTADLQAYAAPGQRIDVTVSSIGNAQSLEGGTLLLTPLKGSDLEVYAVGQGALSVGGYRVTGSTGSRVQKNHTNVGRIPNGALVERAVPVTLPTEILRLNLRSPDFTTALRVVASVDAKVNELAPTVPVAPPPSTQEEGAADSEKPEPSVTATREPWAAAADPATIAVRVPESYRTKVATLIAEIEGLDVVVDVPARVVVNERTGTVVLGDNVRLSPVAIAHGGLTLEVRETQTASQPNPFGRGKTVVVPNAAVSAKEGTGALKEVGPGASLRDVVAALNALGVTPRDLVAILQALKSAGALRAELEVQ